MESKKVLMTGLGNLMKQQEPLNSKVKERIL